jgi:hypothetical protein
MVKFIEKNVQGDRYKNEQKQTGYQQATCPIYANLRNVSGYVSM